MIEFLPPHQHSIGYGLETGVQPTAIIQIKNGSEWYTPADSIHIEPLLWYRTLDSDYLRIPIAAYRIEANIPYLACGAFSWGMQLLEAFQKKFNCTPKKVQLVQGKEAHTIDNEDGTKSIQVYIGVSFCMKG